MDGTMMEAAMFFGFGMLIGMIGGAWIAFRVARKVRAEYPTWHHTLGENVIKIVTGCADAARQADPGMIASKRVDLTLGEGAQAVSFVMIIEAEAKEPR